jgi:hypothetical protein
MFRTLLACVATAAITVAVTSSLGFASHSNSVSPLVRTIGVGETAIFARNDLICINEPPSGAPRFKQPGVACSSYARPYHGIGVWLTRSRVVVTRPPNGKAFTTYRR